MCFWSAVLYLSQYDWRSKVKWGGFYGIVLSRVNKDNATASGTWNWISGVARTTDAFATWQVVNASYGPNDLEGHWGAENVLYAPYGYGVRWFFAGGSVWFDFPLDSTSDASVTKY